AAGLVRGPRSGPTILLTDHADVAPPGEEDRGPGTLDDAAEAVFSVRRTAVGATYCCDMGGWVQLAGTATVLFGAGELSEPHATNESASVVRASFSALWSRLY
ncbi:MAG: hypothetical protein P8180_05160, partial [Gammaproteobacteria bacterium]